MSTTPTQEKVQAPQALIGRLVLGMTLALVAMAPAAHAAALPQGQGPKPPRNRRNVPRRLPNVVEPTGPIGPTQDNAEVRLDQLIGFVGDEAILDSVIRTQIMNEANNAADPGPLSRSDVRALRRDIVYKVLRQEFLAQSTFTLDSSSRERIDAYTEERLRELRENDIRRAGSVSNYAEGFRLLGTSLESVERTRRTQTLADIAPMLALQRRKLHNDALAVTPREMRAFYNQNAEYYAGGTDVGIVTVRTPEQARTVATLWRQEGLTVETLQAKAKVKVEVERRVRAADADPRVAMIKEHAALPVGTVSTPIARDGEWAVLKVLSRDERGFRDPIVQAQIRRRLASIKQQQLKEKLISESRTGVTWWIDPEYGRR